MAIKGLVDLEAFVISDYATPETYYQISVGEYGLDDYVDLNYAFEAQTFTSSFSVSCEGTTHVNTATLTSSFSLSCDADKFDFASATLTSTSSLSASGGRIRTGEGSYTSSATTSTNAVVEFVGTATPTTTTTTSTNAIYTAASESLTLTGFYSQIQLAGKLIEAGASITPTTSEYTWASFKESEIIDRAWTDWFGDRWGSAGQIILISVASYIKALGGYLAQGEATMSATASMPTATCTRIRGSTIPCPIVVTTSTNGNATYGPSKSVSTGVTMPTPEAMRFRGISSGGNPYEMPMGAFTTSTNGIYLKAQGNATQTITASVSGIGSVTFDLGYGQGITAAFTNSTNGYYTAASESLSLIGFYTNLTVGRLISPADPWNTITIPQELRNLLVPEEIRQIAVLQETRLNKLMQETRLTNVDEETRTWKIFKPVYTDRTNIPRVRSEV